MYDVSALKFYVARGAELVESVLYIESNPLVTLDDCIGFLIAAIDGGNRSRESILAVWDRIDAVYSDEVCLWLLDKFEGSDAVKDLWVRDAEGRYSSNRPELIEADRAA